MASPSERLAEVRAALLELEACIAKYRGVRVPRRTPSAAADAPDAAARAALGTVAGDARRPPFAQRILRPPLYAVVAWWRRTSTDTQTQSGTKPRP